jgi:DNA-binding IclR family transcriptional regulator
MSNSTGDRAETGVRSIVRAVDILGCFDARHPTRTLREIVDAAGLPKTTVVRLLATLQSQGLVLTMGDATYAPGAALLRWTRLAQTAWEVNPATRAILRELVDQCGETVNIYIRQDTERICIAQEEGTATVRSVVNLGASLPLSRGASGKVLLTGAPAPVLERACALETDLSAAALRRDVKAAADLGYAVTHQERELGASAVAAPIHGSGSRTVAALSIGGPTNRFTDLRVTEYVHLVTNAARRITDQGMGTVEAFL